MEGKKRTDEGRNTKRCGYNKAKRTREAEETNINRDGQRGA